MYTLTIEKMSCEHCARRITTAIRSVDESAHMEFDLKRKRLRLASPVELSKFIRSLEDAGYPAVAAEPA